MCVGHTHLASAFGPALDASRDQKHVPSTVESVRHTFPGQDWVSDTNVQVEIKPPMSFYFPGNTLVKVVMI